MLRGLMQFFNLLLVVCSGYLLLPRWHWFSSEKDYGDLYLLKAVNTRLNMLFAGVMNVRVDNTGKLNEVKLKICSILH